MESQQKEKQLSDGVDINMTTEESRFLMTALMSPPVNVPNAADIPTKASVPPDHGNV